MAGYDPGEIILGIVFWGAAIAVGLLVAGTFLLWLQHRLQRIGSARSNRLRPVSRNRSCAQRGISRRPMAIMNGRRSAIETVSVNETNLVANLGTSVFCLGVYIMRWR